MMVNAGDSRKSSMSLLYATPSTMTFEPLGHLRCCRGRHWDRAREDETVQCRRDFAGLLVQTADHFRNIVPRHRCVAGIFTLRGECNPEFLIARRSGARCFQPGPVLF